MHLERDHGSKDVTNTPHVRGLNVAHLSRGEHATHPTHPASSTIIIPGSKQLPMQTCFTVSNIAACKEPIIAVRITRDFTQNSKQRPYETMADTLRQTLSVCQNTAHASYGRSNPSLFERFWSYSGLVVWSSRAKCGSVRQTVTDGKFVPEAI